VAVTKTEQVLQKAKGSVTAKEETKGERKMLDADEMVGNCLLVIRCIYRLVGGCAG
jgi:hypothetical protein